MKPCRTDDMAKLDRALADDSPYIAEEKFDGCRYYSIGNRLFSSHLAAKDQLPVEKTYQLSGISEQLTRFGNAILDGEIYIPGKASYDVASITNSHSANGSHALRYVVFDILALPDGTDITRYNWGTRRKILEQLFDGAQLSLITLSSYRDTEKAEFLQHLWKDQKEGVVLKNVTGKYVIGKRPMWNWIKIKRFVTEEVRIVGFVEPTMLYTGGHYDSWPYWYHQSSKKFVKTLGSVPVTKTFYRGWIGAIEIGHLDGQYAGCVSGFDESIREYISNNQQECIGKIIEISAMERLASGLYRHPTFIAFREDLNG